VLEGEPDEEGEVDPFVAPGVRGVLLRRLVALYRLSDMLLVLPLLALGLVLPPCLD
jgi:hypothetical protein